MPRSWVSGGGSTVSYGSNATAVNDVNAGGVATTVSRSDHRHLGVAGITSSTSNTMADPTVNLRAGANIGFALDVPTNTLTISGSAAGTTLSYASNSTQVADANAAGASTLVSRADHRHMGVASIISNSSNTLADPTVYLQAGTNVAFGVNSATNTLTISSTATGGSTISYASNSTQVADANAAGASTLVSRADHRHLGVAAIVSNTSNTMADPTVYLQAGANVAFDVNAATNTLTISSSGGGGGGASISYASNSNTVGTANAAGASSLVSRADHVHQGFAVVTSSSSNTLTPSTLNLRAGTGIALGVDASATNQTVTITNIGGSGGSGTSSTTTDLTDIFLLMGG